MSLENALMHLRSRGEITLRILLPQGATPTMARLRSVRTGHERRKPYPPHRLFDLEHLIHAGKWRSQEIFRSAAHCQPQSQPHPTLLGVHKTFASPAGSHITFLSLLRCCAFGNTELSENGDSPTKIPPEQMYYAAGSRIGLPGTY